MTVTERIEQLGGVQELARGVDVSDAGRDGHLERIVEVAAHIVCRFAPGAPAIVQREAVWRCASWMLHSTKGSITSVTTGPRETSYGIGQLSALRHSGAMAILSPWKVRNIRVCRP